MPQLSLRAVRSPSVNVLAAPSIDCIVAYVYFHVLLMYWGANITLKGCVSPAECSIFIQPAVSFAGYRMPIRCWNRSTEFRETMVLHSVINLWLQGEFTQRNANFLLWLFVRKAMYIVCSRMTPGVTKTGQTVLWHAAVYSTSLTISNEKGACFVA